MEGAPERIYEGIHCTIALRRPVRGVVVVAISGHDVGELGDAPFHGLDQDLQGPPLHLFIDARSAKGASVDVSNEWAQWLSRHQTHFEAIYMLTGSRFIQLTADFVRKFAELGERMSIYTDAAAFDEKLAEIASLARERAPDRID